MPVSPSVANYFIGKGNVYFTEDGGAERHLGNCPTFRLAPAVEKLDHFSSMQGVKKKDQSITVEQTLTLTLVLDEYTPENLRMILLGGTIGVDSGGDISFPIFDAAEIKGSIRLFGTNDVGNQYSVILNAVSFGPSGELDFISDEYGQIELTGEVLDEGSGFGYVSQHEAASA